MATLDTTQTQAYRGAAIVKTWRALEDEGVVLVCKGGDEVEVR